MATVINNEEGFTEHIVKALRENNGLRTSELVELLENKFGINSYQLEDFIQGLIKNNKIIEVEYTSDMQAVSSFLLPPKTSINIRGVPPAPPRRVV